MFGKLFLTLNLEEYYFFLSLLGLAVVLQLIEQLKL